MKTKIFFAATSLLLLVLISGYTYYSAKLPTTLSDAGYDKVRYVTTPGDNPEGTWGTAPNFPLSPRYYGAYCTYTSNDTTWLFVLGGDTTGSGHPTRTSLKYNFRTNQWSQIAPMPIPLRTHTAAVAGDSIFIYGGLDSPTSNGVSNMYKYSINENTWTSRGNLPTPVFFMSSASFGDSVIILAGGVTQNTLDGDFGETLITYADKLGGNFFKGKNLPEGLAAAAFFAALFELDPLDDGASNLLKGYLIGGFKEGSVLSADVIECSIDIFDSNNTTYTVHSNVIPGGGLARHTAAPLADGKLLVSGGVRTVGFTPINSHYIFDPATISFTQLPNSNFPICAHYSGVAFDGNQYKFMTTAGITTGPALTNMSQVYSDSVTIGITYLGTEIPEVFSLKQNYPNPFNPVTKIRFDITAGNEVVRLTVFDITGREISSLVNQKLSPGSYEYTFDASGIPSGVYFYRLTTGETSVTKKMTLLK